MENRYLDWPFFDNFHHAFAQEFGAWAAAVLPPYEDDAGGDGRAAGEIWDNTIKDIHNK